MGRRLPPVNALRAFEAAARHESFKAAADELNVTPAAVSQHVKALEAYFGTTLFIRHTRALELTAVARRALPLLTNGFDRLAEGAAELSAQSRGDILVVSVPPSFGAKWLVPRLEGFRQAYPAFDVRIDASESLATFVGDGVDLAIRYGRGAYGNLRSERIITDVAVPVCSPGLLAAGPALATPNDLRHFRLLHVAVSHAPDLFPTWKMWLQAAGADQVDPTKGLTFNVASMAVDAAVAGQGVALTGISLARDDLDKGRLVSPFPAGTGDGGTALCYYLVYPSDHAGFAKVKAFRRWLLAEIEAQAPPRRSA